MSEIIDFLRTRRSVKPRDMSGAGPSPAELETILTIGARVPDHGKIAPWRFIVFEGDARKKAGEIFAQVLTKKNPDASEQDIAKARDAFMEAPLVIAVVSSTKPHPKVPPWEQQLSAGASAMNIVTAATALGYGANWLTEIGTAPGKGAIFAFSVAGAHAHDIAQILDRYGIAVRAGTHCAEPLMRRFGVTSSARASFALYNTLAEADAFVEALTQARTFFQ